MAVALIIASTALATVETLRSGSQQAAGAKYNALLAEAESGAVARSAAFERETLTQQSKLEQARTAREKSLAGSKQRALYAKAGVRLEGSPLEVMADTAAQYELDLSTQRYNLATGLEKIRYESEVKQAQLAAQAQWQRSLAKAYKTSSYLMAGATLLGGAYSAGKAGGAFGKATPAPKPTPKPASRLTTL
jgi:hypothetical protein